MAEKREPDTPWGTREELLLTCAVHRYGTKSWDSVAIEIQKRTSSTNHLLTPNHCKQKFNDLKRRYKSQNDPVSLPDDDQNKADTVPWLDDLRKLHVAELKRDLQRYDLSIVSLQLKVKKLKEESENGVEKSDPEKSVERESEEAEKREPKYQFRTGVEPDIAVGLTKPVGDDSCNGSSNSIEKEPVPVKAEPEGGVSESPELESVAESKSDVRGPENEDQSSSAIKRISVQSHPLVDFLEIVRSHQLGSVFERRLESQETPEYRNLIRKHIDLETMQMRLEEGWYSGCNSKFFRDLMLLFNNAILFFGKNSKESDAANELWQLISKETNQRSLKLDLSAEESSLPPEEQTSLPLVSLSSRPESEPSDSSLLKPKISGTVKICRTRSSIAAKAMGSSSGTGRKREQKSTLLEEPIIDRKQPNKSSGNTEEYPTTKKRTSDRCASGSRISKENSKSQAYTKPNKISEALSSQNQGKGASSSYHSDPKNEKNNTTIACAKKTRSAANSLNRTKRSSSTNNGSLLETLKISTSCSNNNRGAEQRNCNGKFDGRKDHPSRRGSGGKQTKEQGSLAKRSIRQPTKRATAPPFTPSQVSGKRSREGGDTETSRQPKKRLRR